MSNFVNCFLLSLFGITVELTVLGILPFAATKFNKLDLDV